MLLKSVIHYHFGVDIWHCRFSTKIFYFFLEYDTNADVQSGFDSIMDDFKIEPKYTDGVHTLEELAEQKLQQDLEIKEAYDTAVMQIENVVGRMHDQEKVDRRLGLGNDFVSLNFFVINVEPIMHCQYSLALCV